MSEIEEDTFTRSKTLTWNSPYWGTKRVRECKAFWEMNFPASISQLQFLLWLPGKNWTLRSPSHICMRGRSQEIVHVFYPFFVALFGLSILLKMSTRSVVFNLINCIIGVSVLAMPFCFQEVSLKLFLYPLVTHRLFKFPVLFNDFYSLPCLVFCRIFVWDHFKLEVKMIQFKHQIYIELVWTEASNRPNDQY